MTILEPVLDSSNPRCNEILSKSSGAVANTCSRTNMVLTTAPLYELVWSKQGLSHKPASSSSTKRKASLLWSNETLVISSPNCNHGVEKSNGRNLCEHSLSSLHSESRIEDKDYKVTPAGLPQNICGPGNCSATTESSLEKEQMSNRKVDSGSTRRTTLECPKEVTEKCTAPCLRVLSSYKEPTVAKYITPTNICSASTSKATKSVLPSDVARKMKFKIVESQHKNWVGTFGSTFNYTKQASGMKKGKESLIHDVDDGRSSSNRREDDHENLECISSRGIVSTVKRARTCDTESEKLIGGKKLKQQNNGNCSFMNWVTTITNGLTKPSTDAPMEFFQYPSQHAKEIISPLSISDKKGEVRGVSHGFKGFKSIFHCPGYNISSDMSRYVDNQKELVTLKGTEGEKQDRCSELVRQSRHIFPKNLWMMRYTHKLSAPSPMTVQHSEHSHPYLEAQNNRWSEMPQHNFVSHTENSESKLQLTLSSKYCRRSETMSSTFYKRLDSSVHNTPSKNVDGYTGENKMCLFCGMCDHNISECTKVVEAKLDHYLKNKPLYNRIKRASCFCIICFHLDHWAASCPNVSSKGNQVLCNANSLNDVNLRGSLEKHQHHHFSNQFGAIMLWSVCKKCHQVDNESKDTDYMVSTNISSQNNESGCCGTLDLHMNRIKDATNMDKMMVAADFSSQNEVKRSGFTPFSSHVSTKIPSGLGGIFIFVRKLRLSRADIIRWMNSSTPCNNLTGFFLRLRIGKLEKGCGGARYHVACITGASSKRSIFVCVGSSIYSVTSRFISNQDFSEDELNTWWFQKLRDGSKIPTKEELNEKLQLRKKFEL